MDRASWGIVNHAGLSWYYELSARDKLTRLQQVGKQPLAFGTAMPDGLGEAIEEDIKHQREKMNRV